MFVVNITYTVELEEVDAHLPAHVQFLQQYYQQGVFLASGRKVPRAGGMIFATAKNQTELEAILHNDPFYLAGLANYEITEIEVSKTASGLSQVLTL
ncbi:YciI family protein [Pseudoalteromonas sp. PPB1]|uniref:YciI family protein n=1 Tax=Pseudoalteromonas sp. PPB1 TaxID=2756136 RepID=UPI0018918947|nr:YciI family protein [Pseudoalteromonas sp. PPB1]